jgi:hypothetical protein
MPLARLSLPNFARLSAGTQRRERQIAGLMLVAYVLLALAFSLGPIFEGPDEIEHYRFIRALVHDHALPDPYAQVRSQYHQAPLYYLLATPLALLTDDADFGDIDGRLNPYYPFEIGIPGNDNKNLYLHTRAEAFPYNESGTARAVHVIRLLSIALGVCTLLASYAIFRLLWPDRPDRRLMALAVVAFTPQFLYLSGTINIDNLLYLLTTLTLLLLLRQLRDGPSRRGAVLLGLVLGAALLTKVNAVFLVFPVGLTFLMDRRSWRSVPLILAISLVIAGWWYVRNVILYGDPTGVRVLLETWKTETIRPGAIALDVGLPRLPYAYQTYWARFGQGAVPVAQPIYVFFDGLVVVTIAGLAIWLIRRRSAPGPALLAAGREGEPRIFGVQILVVAVFGLSWVAALVYYASTAWSGNQGRYLLPGIAAWGALIALGLDQWTPRRLRMLSALIGAAVLAAIAAVSVFGYFLPAYSAAPAPPPGQIAHPLRFQYGDMAELIGMSPAEPRARPGDIIHITLYWRALRPTAPRVQIQTYLHSADSDVVKRDSLPGTGNLLSTDWLPGQTWAENYIVPIPSETPIQVVYPLLAGLYDPAAGQNLPVTDGSGNPVTPVIGRIAINGPAEPAASAYRFGGVIGLAKPRISRSGDRVAVCLRWFSLAQVTTDYHVFVHVLAGDGSPVAQADFQPKGGHYPTGAWTPGEAIDDCSSIDAPSLPTSGWQIELGLYDLSNSQRLPVQDDAGNTLPDGRVLLLPESR